MERALTAARLADTKSAIANLWLGEAAPSRLLGTVTLRPHQEEALARLRAVLAEHRAALLADDVGLGKTYVALAVAREYRAPVIVAPAALRPMWREALASAGVSARCLSYEQLSRGDVPSGAADLVVLDEAQHARTPSTQRYARLAALAAGARLLLLSATPIHNARNDLTSLFALALGHRARSLTDTEISVHTVRRTHRDVPSEPLPSVQRREWIHVPDDSGVLHEILALPPPLPPRGGGDGGALLAWTLVRLWASTRGALLAALRRRVQRGWALRQALESGVHPSARELAVWQCSDQAVQLAFPELVAPPVASTAELLSALDRHLSAVETLRQSLTNGSDPDRDRADALRVLRARRAGERILVFTQFADSAVTIWRLLRSDPGVAVLASRGAEVAGGAITRREALCRFAPLAHRAPEPAAAEAITMLISTDLLSEGVNLQDASTVVHLDLPWTHARLEQRVGRVRRMGSRHAEVRVFTFAPPAAAERVLAAERRIMEKLGAAARTIGIVGAILPSVPHASEHTDASPTPTLERLRATIATWRRSPPAEPRERTAVPFTSVSSDRTGALVALRIGTQPITLAAWIDDRCSTEPHDLLATVSAIERAAPAAPDERSARAVCRRVEGWAQARAAERAAGGAISIQSAASRAMLRRLSTIVAHTPRARRQHAAALAARARRAASCTVGVGGELILGRLAVAPMPDDAWLRAVAAFAEAHGAGDPPQGPDQHQPAVCALIVLTGPASARAPVPDAR